MANITPTDTGISFALSDIDTKHLFSSEQLRCDVDYYRAQHITKSMLDAGLISLSQFNKKTDLNRRYFSPFLAEIMPKSLDKPDF